MENNKKNKVLKITLIVIASVLAFVLLVGGIVFFYLKSKMDMMNYEYIDESSLSVSDNEVLTGYRNIAIFGIDTRGTSYGLGNRSDCIIIASVNNATKEVRLVSVYRDTYLKIDGIGLDKATHAYSYGGAQRAVKMLNENLDLNITEFVTVNFDAVVSVVDLLGGVEIDVEQEEITHLNAYIENNTMITGIESTPIEEPGRYNLDGIQALAYSRIRYTAGGDHKRAERMREVMEAMLTKLKTKSVAEIDSILNVMLPKISTNLKMEDFVSMIPTVMKLNMGSSTGWPYNVKGAMIRGVWYGLPNTLEDSVRRLHVELFDDEGYIVPDGVKKISEDIVEASKYQNVTESDEPSSDESGQLPEVPPDDSSSSVGEGEENVSSSEESSSLESSSEVGSETGETLE